MLLFLYSILIAFRIKKIVGSKYNYKLNKLEITAFRKIKLKNNIFFALLYQKCVFPQTWSCLLIGINPKTYNTQQLIFRLRITIPAPAPPKGPHPYARRALQYTQEVIIHSIGTLEIICGRILNSIDVI